MANFNAINLTRLLYSIDAMKEKVVESNAKLLKRSESLKEYSEMLLAQIEGLKKENSRISEVQYLQNFLSELTWQGARVSS